MYLEKAVFKEVFFFSDCAIEASPGGFFKEINVFGGRGEEASGKTRTKITRRGW